MTATVVTWNINRQSIWRALDSLGPDVALLNEAVMPRDRNGVWADKTEGLDGKNRPWSAAVVTPHPFTRVTTAYPEFRGNARPLPVEPSRQGVWCVAVVEVPGLGSVTAISLYGIMDELSDASMHRSLSDITALLDDPRLNHLVVLGGDFNTGTQWTRREAKWQRRDAGVLERIEHLGLVDLVDQHRASGPLPNCPCTLGEACRHVRTRLDKRWPDRPFQTDYLFGSRAIAERTVDCRVLATDEWFSLSDHAPIVATIGSDSIC